MIGADSEALTALAAQLDAAASQFEQSSRGLRGTLYNVVWKGRFADEFRMTWDGRHMTSVQGAAAFLRTAARTLRTNAEQQQHASLAGTGGAAFGSVAVLASRHRVDDALERISRISESSGLNHKVLKEIESILKGLTPAERNEVIARMSERDLRLLIDQMYEHPVKGGFRDEEKYAFLSMLLPSLSTINAQRLMGAQWGYEVTLGHARALGSGTEFGANLIRNLQYGPESLELSCTGPIGEDQIEIRKLDNGQYVVILPGVVDLSNGLKEGATSGAGAFLLGGIPGAVVAGSARAQAEWAAGNATHSARDMYYAQRSEFMDANGSSTGTNAYALAVKDALMRAGVRSGDSVMLVGHSFGAYTAVELASDPTFNEAMGGALGAYHVNVTHVVGAGADVGFRMSGLPAETRGLLLNSDQDKAFRAEAVAPSNGGYVGQPGHDQVLFKGGSDGFGHQVSNYEDFVRTGGDPVVQSFFDDAAANGYSGAGEVVRVNVEDPYRGFSNADGHM